MANARSPNYPSMSLPEAIERLEKVYAAEHTHKAPSEVVAKALGYQSLNGKSITVLSTLKKYGLLEEVGKELKVSKDGLIILVDPPDSEERATALRRAAFSPALFEEIRKNYGETVPSDENLRSFLLRRGFLQSAVDAPIRAYRETVALVSSLPKGENPREEDDEEEDDEVESPATGVKPSGGEGAKIPPPGTYRLGGKQVGSSIPVTAHCSMTIIADGEVTQEGLERLVQYIGLIKNWFPATEQTND